MPTTPIWKKPRSERSAAFAAAFANVEPAESDSPPLTTQLRSVRALILKRRGMGYTVDQICTALKHPAIAIDASTASVRRILNEADRQREQRRKARIAKLMPVFNPTPAANKA